DGTALEIDRGRAVLVVDVRLDVAAHDTHHQGTFTDREADICTTLEAVGILPVLHTMAGIIARPVADRPAPDTTCRIDLDGGNWSIHFRKISTRRDDRAAIRLTQVDRPLM